MKKRIFSFSILGLVLIFNVMQAKAQTATLEHNGVTTVFNSSINSFVDAYAAAANGDKLYLSAGFFNVPTGVAKKLRIIGSGHFPDSASVARRTTFTGALNILKGADSLHVEGVFINGTINFQGDANISAVKLFRCRTSTMLFPYTGTKKSNLVFEECFVDGGIDFGNTAVNPIILRSVIKGYLYSINDRAYIEGNVFLATGTNSSITNVFNSVTSSIVKNNIFTTSSYLMYSNCVGNYFYNNIFVANHDLTSNNYGIGNYVVTRANIFVNEANSSFYDNDYHLKTPTAYLGTDGTQVGLYGSTTPFKDKGVSSIPQVSIKSIGSQTDINGNLPVSITVKAQKY